MTVDMLLLSIILCNMLGAAFCTVWASQKAKGWELCNPYWTHVYHKVNWLGAIMLSLIYNALCPIGAICYWIYKLCTVGRR